MKLKVQNPHDKFFKETFSNTAVARDFMSNYLPQSIMDIIDLDKLEPQKDSFINKELQEAFSDLLFKTNINNMEGYIYFLFEHKSYVSKNITLQLLKYMIEIWETKVNKENSNELPVVIPLVIYHGQDEWNLKSTLGEMIKGYEEIPKDLRKYVPNYEYLLYDLSKYTDEEIKGEAQLRIILSLFRDIFTKDNRKIKHTVIRAIEYLRELEDKQTSIEYFETFMKYILNVGQKLTKKDIDDIITRIENSYPEGSEVVMTWAEQLREEGKLKGIEEGEVRALSKTAIRLLTKKFGQLPVEVRTKLQSLDIVTLEIIIDEILEYKSLEDTMKYLQ